MTEQETKTETEVFTDDLSDEALDRDEQRYACNGCVCFVDR
jgi:hypothetical protein